MRREDALLGDDGYAVDASLHSPEVVVSTGNGEILVADRGNFRIRKISTHGMITTVAGTGVEVTGNDGFLATATAIGSIGGLAVDHDGHVYMSDQLGHCVRRIDSTTQLIMTVAGICHHSDYAQFYGENVDATIAKFHKPSGVAVANNGDIVIADMGNQRVRRVEATSGMVTTIAGNGVEGFSGESGIAIDSRVNYPTSAAVTSNGDIIINDAGTYKIRKVDKNGIITVIAGKGVGGFSGDGGNKTIITTMTSSSIPRNSDHSTIGKHLSDSIIPSVGNKQFPIYVRNRLWLINRCGCGKESVTREISCAISSNCHNRPIIVHFSDTMTQKISEQYIASLCHVNFSSVAQPGIKCAVEACVNRPIGVTVNTNGEVFISDSQNHIVRKVDVNGIISTYAGTFGVPGYSGDGNLATNAQLRSPRGLATNSEVELFIADSSNQVIRKVDKMGTISTVVTGVVLPVDVNVGRDGELVITENGGIRITMFDHNGLKIRIAGTYGPTVNGFNPPRNIPLAFVSSVSVLSDHVLVVADTYHHMIQTIDIRTKAIFRSSEKCSRSMW